jgi:hypothetical protein
MGSATLPASYWPLRDSTTVPVGEYQRKRQKSFLRHPDQPQRQRMQANCYPIVGNPHRCSTLPIVVTISLTLTCC